jgi:ABC-type sugar transport system substrate-binding protein
LEIQQGLVEHAEAKGWKVLTTTSGGDPQKQLDDINNYIAQQVDAIVAVPDDSAGICRAVEAAKEAGIPFYTIDRSPQGCQINMTVLSDNYLAGKQSAEEIVKLLTAKYGEPRGKVLEITGNLAQNVAQLRGGGFNDVMKTYPNIQVITKTGDWDAAKGVDIVRDVASAEADLDAIYMHSDAVYTPGTLQVLGELERLFKRGEEGHIILAGVDGSPAALQAIRDGWADQSSNQPIPDFGIIVNYIEMELNGQTIEPGEVVQEGALWSPARIEESDVGLQLFLATTSVTPENVDDPRLWANVAAGRAGATPVATPEA